MPVAVSWPGVYVEEISSGVRTIVGVSTSVTAFIGSAPKGPVNRPVRLFDYGSYEREFGGLSRNSELSYSVSQFFLNGGTECWVVRVAKDADTASVVLKNEAAGVDCLKILANSAGLWGNNLLIDVDYATSSPNETFNLTATEYFLRGTARVRGVSEKFFNLSMDANSPDYAVDTINLTSRIIAAELIAPLRPAVSGTISKDLAGGDLSMLGEADEVKVTAMAAGVLIGSGTFSLGAALQNTATLSDLAKQFGDAMRASNAAVAAISNANVSVNGNCLVVVAGDPAKPNIGLSFADVAPGELASDLGLSAAGYAPAGGTDGISPTAAELTGSRDKKTGLYAMEKVDIFNLMCIPRMGDLAKDEALAVIAAATDYCRERRAFLIVDPLESLERIEDIQNFVEKDLTPSSYSAVFFPWITVPDPLSRYRPRKIAPSGTLAGVFARTDTNRGVWKAPAGTEATLTNVPALAVSLTDPENGVLNQIGCNCLRSFPVYGRLSWGARTMRGADAWADEYKYIPVRRLALFIEESLVRGSKWIVFEPNDEPLWAQIRLNFGSFMHDLFAKGAFQGKSPSEAYFVKCDKETTIQNDINKGIVNIMVGFAPLKPAEFVIIQIQQITNMQGS